MLEARRLRVPSTWTLPDLGGLETVSAAVPRDTTSGTTVVLDSDDLALARWGGRLVHDGAAWRLHLPPHPCAPSLATAHRVAARPGTAPAVLRHAVAPLLLGRQLRRVARLVVRRRPVALVVAGDDAPAAQVCDEEISVHAGRRLTSRFREVVVQPGEATGVDLLDAIELRLLEAGALGREELPREVRILGVQRPGPPDLDLPPDGDRAGQRVAVAGVEAVGDLARSEAHLHLDDAGRAAAATLPVLDRVRALLDPDDELAGVAALTALVEDVEFACELARRLPGRLGERATTERDVALRALRRCLNSDDQVVLRSELRRRARTTMLAAQERPQPARTVVARRVRHRVLAAAGPPAPPTEQDEPPAPGPADPSGRSEEGPAPAAADLDGLARLDAAELGALAGLASAAPGKAPARFAEEAAGVATALRRCAREVRIGRWTERAVEGLEPRAAYDLGVRVGRGHDAELAAIAELDAARRRLARDKTLRWLRE